MTVPPLLMTAVDVLGVVTSGLAAVFWFQASRQRLRRVSRFEELDAADLNRMITAINRSGILNGRAALAATASALCVAVRFAAQFAAGG